MPKSNSLSVSPLVDDQAYVQATTILSKSSSYSTIYVSKDDSDTSAFKKTDFVLPVGLVRDGVMTLDKCVLTYYKSHPSATTNLTPSSILVSEVLPGVTLEDAESVAVLKGSLPAQGFSQAALRCLYFTTNLSIDTKSSSMNGMASLKYDEQDISTSNLTSTWFDDEVAKSLVAPTKGDLSLKIEEIKVVLNEFEFTLPRFVVSRDVVKLDDFVSKNLECTVTITPPSDSEATVISVTATGLLSSQINVTRLLMLKFPVYTVGSTIDIICPEKIKEIVPDYPTNFSLALTKSGSVIDRATQFALAYSPEDPDTSDTSTSAATVFSTTMIISVAFIASTLAFFA